MDPYGRGTVISRRDLERRLASASRVALVCAPAGTGKTLLVRSWIAEEGIADRVAWVPLQGGERDPQRFWISVARALRGSVPGSKLVREFSAAPDLDGWAIVERLLDDLQELDEPVWLVIDDVHELLSDLALSQLELLVMRAPAAIRFVFTARHDTRLRLHRLRLEGELTELRAEDLRFTLEDAGMLLRAVGVELSPAALTLLHERTEGWAAGLRLAALSLAAHPAPEEFAAGFSGGERTVAEYLLAEVLDQQPEDIRRLLLRTSILERVNGELANVLTGGLDGERILHDLERAGAFVISLDTRRTWFRYHQLFAELLRLELRRAEPHQVASLHRTAADWLAVRGHAAEAIRHAQAAQSWPVAAGLLSDHWFSLILDGQGATAQELLGAFPAASVAYDAELLTLTALSELSGGSLREAERRLALAQRAAERVPIRRSDHAQTMLAVLRLSLAGQRGDLPAAVEEAERLLDPAGTCGSLRAGLLRDDLRAQALISLGIAERWSLRLAEADRHLEQGIALAHRIGRPYLEITGLGHWAMVAAFDSAEPAARRANQAIDLAQQHGWSEEPVTGFAYAELGILASWQGRIGEAESWLGRAERTLWMGTEPSAGLLLHHTRGSLERARGRDREALQEFRAADRLAGLLVAPHPLATRVRAFVVHALAWRGEVAQAEAAFAAVEGQERETADMRMALATLRLAQDDPEAAVAALAPVLDGTVPPRRTRVLEIQAFLLEAIARDALGQSSHVEGAIEQALHLAEPDNVVLPFLLHPAPRLLERHRLAGTAHAGLLGRVLTLLADLGAPEQRPAHVQRPLEPLTGGEIRVLRYLPTDLSAPEIARELSLSVHTVKTHIRHIYAKLGVTRRHKAVERARALGIIVRLSRTP